MGPFRQWCAVRAVEQDTPLALIRFHGHVASLWTEEATIQLGVVEPDGVREFDFTVRADRLSEARVTSARAVGGIGGAQVTILEAREESGKDSHAVAHIHGKWRAPLADGVCEGAVVVRATDGVESREISVPVYVTVAGNKDAGVPSCFFGTFSKASQQIELQKTLKITPRTLHEGEQWRDLDWASSNLAVCVGGWQCGEDGCKLTLVLNPPLWPHKLAWLQGEVVGAVGGIEALRVPFGAILDGRESAESFR